jgi:hypothetical protein
MRFIEYFAHFENLLDEWVSHLEPLSHLGRRAHDQIDREFGPKPHSHPNGLFDAPSTERQDHEKVHVGISHRAPASMGAEQHNHLGVK